METIDIDREIRSFLVERFLFGRPERLSDDGSLLGDVIDSVGVLDLVIFLQDRFTITVEDEEIIPENFDSVKHVVGYVEKKIL